MRAVIQQETSLAAGWSRRLAVFSAILLAMSGGGHRFGFIETVPFLWLLGLCCLLALGALIAGGTALVRFWEHGADGVGSAMVGLVVSFLVLAPFGASAVRLVEYPRLVDISTDLVNPPSLVQAAELRHGAMNTVDAITPQAAELQAEHYPRIAGRRYDQASDTVLQAVRALIDERKWRLLGPQQSNVFDRSVTLEAEALSFFLGFPSDVAISVRDDGTATFVDMRSASRYGRHDLGDNAKRIDSFLEDIDERMASQAGV